jgi:hypothetical protein
MTVRIRNRRPIGELIVNEIHAPVLVGGGRDRHWTPMQADPLTPPHPHSDLQPFEPVQPVHALVVHRPPLPSKHDLDAQIPESRTRIGNVANAHP